MSGPAEADAKLMQTDTQVLPAMLCRSCERYSIPLFYTRSNSTVWQYKDPAMTTLAHAIEGAAWVPGDCYT